MTDSRTIGDYISRERLGAGGQATTWLAEPVDGGNELLLKVFHVEVAEDWKAAELFERAAQVLESIDHPNIPAYHDHFEVESDGVVKLCLARDFVAGDSLQDRIDEDGSLSEDEVVELAIELLEVLRYLHAQDPPIVHRDIKPANVILGADGRPYLVDFGAVQAEVLTETGGSTVVGTAGYVAPEQLMGRAEPSSDIYALGVTLVHLLTHTPPTELPSEGFELKFDQLLEASAGLKYVIGRMTRADIEEREASAEGLLEKFRALRDGTEVVVRSSTLPVKAPRGSELEVVDEDGCVVAKTPGPVLFWHHRRFFRYAFPLFYGLMSLLVMSSLFVIFMSVPWLAGGCLVAGVAGSAWIWEKRRELRIELRAKALRIEVPPIRMWPDAHYDSQGRKHYRDPYNNNLLAPWRSFVVRYKYLEEASVIHQDSSGGSGGQLWRLRLDVEHGEGRPPKMGTHSDRDVVSGDIVFDLGLSHGEYLWLAKLINKRVAQYRELEE